MFDEDLDDLDWESLDEDDWELKFFTWSRKIEEHILWLEEEGTISKEEVCYYLNKCAFLREKFLDPSDLTETEEFYMEEIQPIWNEYKRTDPIYEKWKEL